MNRIGGLTPCHVCCATLLVMSGCSKVMPTARPRDIAGVDITTGLMIFFKEGATSAEILEFWDKVLSIPGQGGGYAHRPGISGIMTSVTVDRLKSVAVDFWSDATQDQKDALIRDVKVSPLVYKVVQNVVPSSIKKVD